LAQVLHQLNVVSGVKNGKKVLAVLLPVLLLGSNLRETIAKEAVPATQ